MKYDLDALLLAQAVVGGSIAVTLNGSPLACVQALDTDEGWAICGEKDAGGQYQFDSARGEFLLAYHHGQFELFDPNGARLCENAVQAAACTAAGQAWQPLILPELAPELSPAESGRLRALWDCYADPAKYEWVET